MRRMRVIGYVRVSTEEQVSGGYSLEAQESAIEMAANARGWEIEKIFRDEGKSGKDLHRPGIHNALLAVCGRPRPDKRTLMVARLDRLTRSVVDFGELLEWFDRAHAGLVCLDLEVDTTTPGGRLVANVFAAVAEWERETIAQRTRDGLAEARRQGKPISRPALEDRPEIAARVRYLREQGLSLREIADYLNATNTPTLRGAPIWRKSAVQHALGYKRPKQQRKTVQLPEPKRGKCA